MAVSNLTTASSLFQKDNVSTTKLSWTSYFVFHIDLILGLIPLLKLNLQVLFN